MGKVRYLISGILIALALLIPSMISDVYANPDISLSQCGTLAIPGETYVLNYDLISSQVCFKIVADGITLDGNGHTITSLTTLGQVENIGVDVSGTTGVTVKNMKILDFRTGIAVTASDTSLINNFITNAETGIHISNSCVATLTSNTVNSGTDGIVITSSSGVTINWNTANDNSDDGINISNSHGTVLTGNTAGISEGQSNRGISINSSNDNFLIDSTHLWGIKLLNSNDNSITGNEISNHKNEIASNAVALQIMNSDNNTFNYNTISNNDSPFEITESTNNKIYNNNFISNSNEARIQSYVIEYGIIIGVVSDTSGSNIFNRDLPVGGNYWDNFDQASEGCYDIDSNSICDVPFVSFETQDNFAWTIPDGWLVNSSTIPDVDSIVIHEIAHCTNSEIEPEITLVDNSDVINEDTPVVICHMPPGNTDNPQEIQVSMSEVDTHLAHGDHIGSCEDYELGFQEFSDEILTDNETLNEAINLLRTIRENLNADSDVGDLILQAADLYKLFEYEDINIKLAFQSVFNQFIKDVEAFYGDTLTVSEKFILHELNKAAIKMQIQINKAENEEQLQNKIQSTIQFVNAQEQLQKIKNQIGIEKNRFVMDNERLEDLKLFELDLLKQTLLFTAKIDGETITPKLLKDIETWAEEKIKENHKKNDGNGNSNDDDDGKSNKGKSNSGNGNGDNGNSGKGGGNSGKGGGNSGKGKRN
ncbi:hypothetical protein LCGC14_1232050 [marine sediment metagenome]|uniref:Periplasmic copper-binding protein NosD beta helix domain-containing protein n=1 Tax=marine sediment metagenome TaxID=412755 RepID=A0A0F9LCC9_9ZZZZ